MAEENATSQPRTDDEGAAADVRMLYEVNIADIRESKAQEWRITFQVFLLYGAFIAADELLRDIYDCLVSAAVLLAVVVAIGVLWRFRLTIVERRRKLCDLEPHLSVTAQRQFNPKNPWHDWWVPFLLTVLMLVGMAAAVLIVLDPDPLLSRCFTVPRT